MSARTAPHKQFPAVNQFRSQTSGQLYPTYVETGNLIKDLGHYGGLHAPYAIENLIDLELKSVQSAVKLAKQVNLANETEHLVVRDILVDKDFRDQNGNAISGRAWVQPWSGWYTSVETDVEVYRINRDADYHNKVYVFWGLRYVNRGPADINGINSISSITWKDSSNTYDIWETEGLDIHKEMYAFKPLLIKNYVDYSIYVRPKITASGQFDNIQILGKVCEAVGNSLMGSPSKVEF